MARKRKPPLTYDKVVPREDPVTHEVVYEQHDAVFRAIDRAAGAVEQVGLDAPTNGFMAPWRAAARDTLSLLEGLEDGTISPDAKWSDPPRRALAYWWKAVGGNPRFVAEVRARLSRPLLTGQRQPQTEVSQCG